MTVSPDGKLLAVGHFSQANGPGTVRIWDIELAVEIRSMEGHSLEISSVAFSPDGKTVLSTSFDKTLRLWDVDTGKELKRFAGHYGPVEASHASRRRWLRVKLTSTGNCDNAPY